MNYVYHSLNISSTIIGLALLESPFILPFAANIIYLCGTDQARSTPFDQAHSTNRSRGLS